MLLDFTVNGFLSPCVTPATNLQAVQDVPSLSHYDSQLFLLDTNQQHLLCEITAVFHVSI